jgi:hypothetical protein
MRLRALLLLAGLWLLAACAAPAQAPTATTPPPPSARATTATATLTQGLPSTPTTSPSAAASASAASPTATASPAAEISTATAVAIAAASAVPLDPVAEAAAARFDSWSPDNQWLAYWLSTREDMANSSQALGYAPRASLYLLNVVTHQRCAYPQLVSYDYDSKVAWLPDEQIVVYAGEAPQQGHVCQDDFAPAGPLPTPVASGTNPALSPGGDYRATTREISSTEGALYLSTAIIDRQTGQVLSTVDWSVDQRLGGGWGLGGEWANDTQFLIYETRERGPLLVNAGAGVIAVAPELFGVPADPGWPAVFYQAVVIRRVESQVFHIVLSAAGEEHRFPPLRLCHSESGSVETLPYTHLWAPVASPDGRWLLLDGRPERAGYESYALWARPVDPPGSEAHFIGEGTSLWAPGWGRVAFGLRGTYTVVSFPEGAPLQAGRAKAPYQLNPRAWSPDGRWIVFQGYTGSPQEALFVVDTRP